MGEATEVSDLTVLQDFIVENDELERLEALLDRFNIFEAIGAVRQELRHSDFLAFLLDPAQSHGLGELFATRLLQRALRTAQSGATDVRPIDLELWNLSGLQVRREWRDIDILLVDDINRLVVLIENKIDSAEHSNQLVRYWDTIAAEFPDYRAVALLLSPGAVVPSHDRYIAIGYESVCALVEEISQRRVSSLGADVAVLLSHYAQMLRRRIVSDAEIADLCRRIYGKHRRALDLIFEYRPDRQEEMREFLERLIQDTPGLMLDACSKGYIRFLPTVWNSSALRVGSGWTSTGRMLLFEFTNEADRLRLVLWLGPGPEQVRQKLFDLVLSRRPPFSPNSTTLWTKHNSLYSRTILPRAGYGDKSMEELQAEVQKHWQAFVTQDLPSVTEIVSEEVATWSEELSTTSAVESNAG